MKKTLVLILALVVALSLCACGGAEKSDTAQTAPPTTEDLTPVLNLCQEWKAVASGDVVSFDEEGYFHIYGSAYKYQYDEEASTVFVDVGIQVSMPITLVDGIYRIDVDGMECVPVSDYEMAHAKYAETMMVVSSFEGAPALNAALVKEHISRVELTVDNWREYIKEYTYDVELVEKDAFGEITNTETVTVYRLGYGTERYYCLSATIELQHKQTGELVLFGENLASNLVEDINVIRSEPFNLDEYECTRIKGYMYFIDYPEEVFAEVMNEYDRDSIHRTNAYITVTSDWMEGGWSVDLDASVIESSTDNWAEYFE